MGEGQTRQRLFRLFADLLEYPQSDLSESVRECEALISPGNPEAAALLDPLRSFVADAPLGDIQELYTRTFDLDATYHPYVGHHLFGESYKRSAFMVGLKERYKAYDFVVEGELPDHLAVMLRYLSLCEDDVQVAEIIRDAMVPALERMVKKPADAAEDAPGEAALDGCALDVGVLNGGALVRAQDVSAMDVGAMDVSAMDGCALDVSATDVGALDVDAMDAGVPGDDTPEQSDLEPGVYPQLLHALRLVLQQLPMNDR